MWEILQGRIENNTCDATHGWMKFMWTWQRAPVKCFVHRVQGPTWMSDKGVVTKWNPENEMSLCVTLVLVIPHELCLSVICAINKQWTRVRYHWCGNAVVDSAEILFVFCFRVPIRGEGEHAYLSDRGISSGRKYIRRNWICSKPNSYALHCPGVS